MLLVLEGGKDDEMLAGSAGAKSILEVATDQVHDDFAIGVSLELDRVLERLAQGAVVVNFTVDGEDQRLVLVGNRLSSSI